MGEERDVLVTLSNPHLPQRQDRRREEGERKLGMGKLKMERKEEVTKKKGM